MNTLEGRKQATLLLRIVLCNLLARILSESDPTDVYEIKGSRTFRRTIIAEMHVIASERHILCQGLER